MKSLVDLKWFLCKWLDLFSLISTTYKEKQYNQALKHV